jgi:GntR family transcriptional regulator
MDTFPRAMEVVLPRTPGSRPRTPGRAAPVRQGPEPIALYVRIASVLRGRILRGEWKPGHRLPGINELTQTYGVARATAAQALRALVAEGMIASQRGRGSHVIHRIVPPEESDTGLFHAVAPTPPEHRITIIERKPEVALPAPLLIDGTPFESYMLIRKIHSLRDLPYGYFEAYVPSSYHARFPPKADAREKLFFLLGQAGLVASRRREILTVHSADWLEASHLQGEMAMPIARVLRVVLDQEGRIAYAANNIYRGDRFRQDRTIVGALMEESRASKGEAG